MAPPFRADHVGSLLRPQELKNAFRDAHLGKIDQAIFSEIQDRCIRDAVRLQEDVGLQSITDGEFRRGSWFYGFVQAVDGLTTKDAVFTFHDEGGGTVLFQGAFVDSPLRRTRGITTDEFSFIHALTKRTAKVTMPTPCFMHFFRLDHAVDPAVYPDLDKFWADLITVYRGELAALAKLGCRFVQFDEVPIAMLCDPKIREQAAKAGFDPMQLLAKYIDVFNQVVRDKPAGMTVTMHLCKGNYKGHWMAEGDYEAISERLFQQADVDTFFLEYDSARAGGFEPLRHVPKSKNVVLGLISSKTPQLERIDALRKRVDEATRYISLDQLGVSPQCGFASSVGGNPLAVDDEKRKLALVVELARTIWEPMMAASLVFPQLAPLYAALGPWVEAMLRVTIALCLIPHGLRIYFGMFRNTGMPIDSLQGLAKALDAQGYRPGQLWAPVIIVTELILAPMLAFGLFTRLVSIPIFILLALSVVAHMKDGWFWNTLGVEYPLVWAAASLYFLVNGGGALSLDRLIGIEF